MYIELCEILGISINEFLAGEDISQENLLKKSEDNIIEVTKHSNYRIKHMKSLIAVLIVISIAAISILGIFAYRYISQPKNYITAVDQDSVEMKTAELLSGIDGAFLFDYSANESFRELKLYMTEYQSGELIEKEEIGSLGYEDIESPTKGKVVIIPDFDNKSVRLIVADDCSKYSTDISILEDVDSTYFIRTSSRLDEQSEIQYGSEQGLLVLIYGENSAETTPISSLEQGEISSRNDYMYYFSIVFEK